MPKFVKQVHDLITLAIDKGITNYIPSEQIDNVIDQGQMVLFRTLVKEYLKTKDPVSRNYLLPFEKKASIVVTTGIGPMPTDCEQELEFWATVSGIDYPVFIKETGVFKKSILRYKFREEDPIAASPGRNIFARIYYDSARKIEVYPSTTPLSIIYLIRPVKPVFATTLVDDYPIYDDASSTDVAWSHLVQDILLENTLNILGLSLRDGQVQRTGQKEQPKVATV